MTVPKGERHVGEFGEDELSELGTTREGDDATCGKNETILFDQVAESITDQLQALWSPRPATTPNARILLTPSSTAFLVSSNYTMH